MPITKELLKEKAAELKKAMEDAQAQANAFGGALQFCEHLIETIETEESASNQEAPK